MNKFVPFEKLSKKEQRKLNAQKRRMWTVNPVTRVNDDNKRGYKRRTKYPETYE